MDSITCRRFATAVPSVAARRKTLISCRFPFGEFRQKMAVSRMWDFAVPANESIFLSGFPSAADEKRNEHQSS